MTKKAILPKFDLDKFFDDPNQTVRWLRVAVYGEMGRDAEVYLDRLFCMVREKLKFVQHDDLNVAKLVAYGSRSMAQIVGSIGYQESNSQHRDILSWLLALTEEDEPHLAELSVWALADIGIPPEVVRSKLKEIATGGLRQIEPKHATVRSVAFRMLARISRPDAQEMVGSAACQEYLVSVATWMQELEENGCKGNESYRMHIEESAWLRDGKGSK